MIGVFLLFCFLYVVYTCILAAGTRVGFRTENLPLLLFLLKYAVNDF